MKALYISKGILSLKKNTPTPKLGRNEALIKVKLAGICSTDLELVKGYADFGGIPGHEFVGEVIEVQNRKHNELVGKRIVGEMNLGCGKCEYCMSGIKEHCLNGLAMGVRGKEGVFAEYVTLPAENLHVLPKNVSDKEAVFVEPLAAALRIPQVVNIPIDKQVAVIGTGRLGILICQVLNLSGVKLTVLGRSKNSLLLPKKLGMNIGLVSEYGPKTWDMIVDATGNEEGFTHALNLIKPMGTIVVKSTYNGKINEDISKVVIDEIKIVGSRCGPFDPAIELLSQKRIETALLVEKIYPLSDGIRAFEHASKPGVHKILIKP